MNDNAPKTDIHVKLIGENGNIFNLMGIVLLALRTHGRRDLCESLKQAVTTSKSYEEALAHLAEYVIVE